MSPVQVFLTRPEGRNGSVPQRLQALGMAVHELPALALQPLDPPVHLPQPEQYDLVVFVSRYAVQRYIALLAQVQGVSWHWPSQVLAATVGASSAQALRQAGIPEACIVHPPADACDQDSEALVAALQERNAGIRRALIVRGTQGRGWLAAYLTARDITVDFLPVYQRAPAVWSEEAGGALAQALQTPAQCIFLLTSSEGVQAMAQGLQQMGLLGQWSKAHFIVIHERIGATLQSVLKSQCDAGIRLPVSCLPDNDSIVRAIRAVAGSTAEP